VAEGYWSASNTPEPRWLPTFQWNQQWRDGQSQFHRELGRRGEQWIEWSKRHPDLARALWPRVLTALRRTDDGGMFQAEILLRAAQVAPTVSAFEQMAEEIASQRW
jgi:hypothetical protein